ncbi:hypothetical protein ACH4PU_33605 [Streptomyces sp. NPDC021100]|uniref:hypothetical protein n=1 Tax=Streptomyces sp. NPDC021100 TaxID=3365114 RepID=UPI0037B83CA9
MNPTEFTGTVTEALRRFWAGRRAVLLLDDFDHRARSLVDELRVCGAEVGAVVARTGPGPGAPRVGPGWYCSDTEGELTRPEFEAWLRDPSAGVRAWLDALDPARAWVALGTPRTGVAEFCGRPVHGWRRPEWAAVEDKTTIDRLWEAAGVASPPYFVAVVNQLLRAPSGGDRVAGPAETAGVAGPAGVVVAADSTRGHVGDALGLRWVPDPGRLPDVVGEFAGRAERVRVARFEDGVPCSVLGMALADGVAVFSPIEIVTLGDPATGRLLFCGSSTFWRPGAAAEDDIRGAARRAGAELVRTTGYRGLFSVDGLLTPDGFTATELNPRHASGLGLRAALPDFPLYLYHRAVQERLPGFDAVTCTDLERLVRELVAAVPSASLAVGATRVEAAPVGPDHRAGPACARAAARLGEPGLRAFPLDPSSALPLPPCEPNDERCTA